MTSRKPRVVTIPARPKVRVISAFVATVVPWLNRATSRRLTSAFRRPSRTASIGLPVDGTFATLTAPVLSSNTHTSVNVPPISTATLSCGTGLVLPRSGGQGQDLPRFLGDRDLPAQVACERGCGGHQLRV